MGCANSKGPVAPVGQEYVVTSSPLSAVKATQVPQQAVQPSAQAETAPDTPLAPKPPTSARPTVRSVGSPTGSNMTDPQAIESPAATRAAEKDKDPVASLLPRTPSRAVNTAAANASAEDDVRDAASVPSNPVLAVLNVMKAHTDDAEYQWWCCDALAGLCAGKEDARAQLYVQNGVLQILAAMKLFQWDENVQTKAAWALANMAASYSEYVGKQGGVEAIVSGMRACEESYQVQTQGVRCLQILVANNDANRARAKAAGAEELLTASLEKNPEDGQLQYRGTALLQRLHSLTAEEIAKAGGGGGAGGEGDLEVARNSPWGRLRRAVFNGAARQIAAGNLPGLYGTSALVAAKARDGIKAVVAFLIERQASPEVARWCCDAIATLATSGGAPERTAAFEAGAVPVIIAVMGTNIWDEDLQVKACWALHALAPSYAEEIGAAGGVETVVLSMYKNKTHHDALVAGVKLLSLLTLEPSGENARRAREANAIRIVKNVMEAHSSDHQLQYRGINLLERLEPGTTLLMPKVSMIRTASMRAEELVFAQRSVARQASFRSETARAAANASAIAEVDAEAQQVDDGEEEGGPTTPAAAATAITMNGGPSNVASATANHTDHDEHKASTPRDAANQPDNPAASDSKSESKEQ